MEDFGKSNVCLEGTAAVAVEAGGGWNALLSDNDESLPVLLTVEAAGIPNTKPVEPLLIVSEGMGTDAKGCEGGAEIAAVFSGTDGFTPNIKSEVDAGLVASPAETAFDVDGNVLAALVVARGLSQEAHLTAVLLFCTMHAEHFMKSLVLTSHILFTFGTAATSAFSGLSQDTHLVAPFELGTMHTLHFTLSVATVAQILTAGTAGGFSDNSGGLITATLFFGTTFSLSGNEEEALGKLVLFILIRFLGGEKRY